MIGDCRLRITDFGFRSKTRLVEIVDCEFNIVDVVREDLMKGRL